MLLNTLSRRFDTRMLAVLVSVLMLSGCWIEIDNAGDTGGTVTSGILQPFSSQPKIDCGSSGNECEAAYASGLETLTATPEPGYVFDEWSGACAGQDETCDLNFDSSSYFETKAHFNFTQVTIATIPDQQVDQNFSSFTVQASASSGAGPISYSATNTRPDAVNVSINAGSGELNITPISDQFGNAEIEVFATVGGGNASSTRFGLVVAMPTNPVFACGSSVETETGDTLPGSYTLFEFGQTRPLALSPNGRYLFVTNTPANCLEIYNVEQDVPVLISSVSVGLEPVAVAAKSDTEVWVVNALSDSISIVDIRDRPHVTRTLLVGDEPRDIVFAGPDQKAFITAAFRGQNHPTFTIDDMFTAGLGRGDVWVFDSDNPGSALGGTPITIVNLFSDAPRSLTVSPDGNTVYAAAFFSGNQTTTIDAGSADTIGKPGPTDNVDGVTSPDTGLIVKYDGSNWLDEDGTNWNSQVMFDLPDKDVFVINANLPTPVLTGSHSGVGTTLFNMATAPDGRLFISNTEARNEVRFEGEGTISTTVRGNTTENRVTIIDGSAVTPYHLNHHIDFNLPFGSQVSATDKQKSTAQPGGMVYHNGELWVLSFGSDKVQIFADPVVAGSGTWFDTPYLAHVGLPLSGGGPSGIVIQDYRDRAYVYSRFSHSLSVISTKLKYEISSVDLFSPEPVAVKDGRKFLYDAQLTSGNGTGSCGSCHIFGDLDGLAWDLGDPDASVAANPNDFLPASIPLIGTPMFHPMKGPMTTQTFRGMADSGPMHWRGDRTGQSPVNGESMEAAAFKEFGPAFVGLVGRATELAEPDLQAFTDFALQITPPPNPVRALDDSLTTTQLAGESIYFNEFTTGLGGCNDCHKLDASQNLFGTSKQSTFEGFGISQLFKIPHLRNQYQKVGMFGTSMNNPNETYGGGDQIKGFGYLGDGSIDTLINFFTSQTFNFNGPDPIARRRVSEFSLVFDSNLKPIVGQQVTLTSGNPAVAGPRIDLLIARSLAGDCDLVAWSSSSSTDSAVSARLLANGDFRLSVGVEWTDAQIRSQVASSGEPVTYTCVPPGDGVRISQVP